MAQQRAAQAGDDAVGGGVRREVADGVQHRPGDQRDTHQHESRDHVAQRRVVEQRPVDDMRERHGLHDDDQRTQRGDHQGDRGHPP